MNTNSSRVCSFLAIAVALTGVAAEKPRAGYLPRVGPAPLRFEAPRVPALSISKLPPLPKQDTQALPTHVPPPKPEGNPDSNKTGSTATPPMTSPDGANSEDDPYSLLPAQNVPTHWTGGTPSANDLLAVSPQMLIDYFKPMSNWTNGGAHMLFPVNLGAGLAAPNFTPAIPAPILPPSSATYKVVP